MKANLIRKIVIVVFISGVFLGAVYGGLYGWIQWDAHAKAAEVLKSYPQAADEIQALILRMQDAKCSMKDRNMAVWTLGRLADPKALEALQTEYTDQSCDHGKLLCQYELQKAIQRCGGNTEPPISDAHP